MGVWRAEVRRTLAVDMPLSYDLVDALLTNPRELQQSLRYETDKASVRSFCFYSRITLCRSTL